MRERAAASSVASCAYVVDDLDDEDWTPETDSAQQATPRKRMIFTERKGPTRYATPPPSSPQTDTDLSEVINLDDSSSSEDLRHTAEETLPMPKSRARKLREGQARFTWSKTTRIAVHLLMTKYSCKPKEATAIFDEMFADDLAASAKPNGIGITSLTAQHAEKERKPHIWSSITKRHFSPREQQEREKIMRDIERARARMGRGAPPAAQQVTSPKPSVQLVDERILYEDDGSADEQPQPPHEEDGVSRSAPTTPVSTRPRQEADAPDQPSESIALYTPSPVLKIPPSMMRVVQTRKRNILGVPHMISTPNSPTSYFDPVPPTEAHPELPGLFFRYFDEQSSGVNSAQGFIAGQWVWETVGFPPAPACTDQILFHYLENHLNMVPIPSPFISVSTYFFWVVRHAAKMAAEGHKDGRIAIIDPAALADRTAAFFVPPYSQRLKSKRAFYGEKYRYGGSHEFVVWSRIPRAAVVHVFSIGDLQRYASRIPSLAAALKLHILERRTSMERIRKMIREAEPVHLDRGLTSALAELLLVLRIDASRSPRMVAKFVSDFVQGWGINVVRDTPLRWELLAGTFAHAFTDRMRSVTTEQMERVKTAFLDGLASGQGVYNYHRDEAKKRAQLKKAGGLGLLERLPSVNVRVEITRRPIDLSRFIYAGDSGGGG